MTFEVPEGTVILREGEVSMDIYRVVKGSVELYSGYGTSDETILGILSDGSYFGEVGMLTEKPSIYTVVAYSNLELQRVPADDIAGYFQENIDDAILIMKNMARTMYNLKANIGLLSSDLTGVKADKKTITAVDLNKILDKYNLGLVRKS